MNTNLSRTVSLTVMDSSGDELPIHTSSNDSFDIFIAHDPSMTVPEMFLQDVTSTSNSSIPHHYLFNYHSVNLNSEMNQSIHLEFQSLNSNVSYLLIYRFDRFPLLNTSIELIDGWAVYCASSKVF
jgi:hypothetical protein